MLLATSVVSAMEHLRIGAYLAAIREDEGASEALGVNTFKYKMLAMVVSSFLTGLGGTFYAFYLFSLQPNAVFGIPLSVEIIIRAIVGGAGTVLGPILGAFILSPLAELSRWYFAEAGWAGAHLIAYGVLLVAVVRFCPRAPTPCSAAGSPGSRRREPAAARGGRCQPGVRRPAGRAGSVALR